jgi:hypothetical protein
MKPRLTSLLMTAAAAIAFNCLAYGAIRNGGMAGFAAPARNASISDQTSRTVATPDAAEAASSPNVLTPEATSVAPRILYSPSEADDPVYRDAIASFTGGVVDYFDARVDTPLPALLATYDCVYTWANGPYFDRNLFGNRLADYVDAGGRVILGVFCTFTAGNSLGGRIMTPGYSPVTSPAGNNHFLNSDYARDGTTCIYQGVTYHREYFRDVLVVQGDGLVAGHYQDGEIAQAYQPDFSVIYTNGTGAIQLGGSSDYWGRLIANASQCAPPGPPPPRPTLYACNGAGQLFTIDVTTGQGTLVGNLPVLASGQGASEIEYGLLADRAWLQMKDGTYFDWAFDVSTGAAIGNPVSNLRSFTGLEFVGNTLYGTSIPGQCPAPAGPRLLYAPSEFDDPAYRAAIAAVTGGVVDYFNASLGTPLPSQLATYDCVYTWTNGAYFNRALFGDRLADFVDAGGKVILGVFCTYTSGNSLGGRIMTPGYSPVTSPAGTNHFSTSFWDHTGAPCIHQGVQSYGHFYRDVLVAQGGGVISGRYVDGEVAHAYRADFRVIYSNGTGAVQIGGASGDWARLVGNASFCNTGDQVSDLRTLDPQTGGSVFLGATGLGPITGLAYDAEGDVMYGITGCAGASSRLVTVDRQTGEAQDIGATGFEAGSIEFGPDGNLYGGGTGFDGGKLHRINKESGASVVVGVTGFGNVAGLTLVEQPSAGMPEAAPSALALRVDGFRPNPAARDFKVSFSLLDRGPVTVELIDIAGRRVLTREMGSLGAGSHVVNLGEKTDLPAGIYVVRIAQGTLSQSAKVCVLR